MNSASEWIASRLAEVDFIVSARASGDIVVVERNARPSTSIAVLSLRDVAERDVARFISLPVRFITNIPKEGRFLGDAIEIMEEVRVGWGGFADTIRALRDHDDPAEYRERELSFAMRGLSYLHNIVDIQLLDDKRIHLTLDSGESTTLFICAEYQPTAEMVHRAIQRYGSFDVLAATNPNSYPTQEAVDAGRSAGLEVLRWHELLTSLRGQ